jgi:hypothetical protein
MHLKEKQHAKIKILKILFKNLKEKKTPKKLLLNFQKPHQKNLKSFINQSTLNRESFCLLQTLNENKTCVCVCILRIWE